MDFHRRDPEQKEHAISRLLYHARDFDKALEEAKKCDLPCSNCHGEMTYPDWLVTPQQAQATVPPVSPG